jgi:glycosyltransferase involved in cell wall biosynthesis
MNYKNKFTILIPTRERSNTLFHTIQTCLNQTYNNYEIIISDNYSQDNTKEVVDFFNDSRIKYINTGCRLSMSQNFDFALSHVIDGYLMFIGDDDAILPNSLEYVNDIINKTKCGAVISYNSLYTWPGTANPNKLFWGYKKGFEIRNSKNWINKFLNFEMLYTFDLPSVYCGFVEKSIIEGLTKENIFFKSSIPDAYSAIAVAFTTENYAYSHTPFVIHGASPRSNGGSYLGKGKKEEDIEAKMFFKENTIPFHREIVMTKSFRINAVEAFLQFSDNFPEFTNGYSINWRKLLVSVLTERNNISEVEIEDAVREMCMIHGLKFDDLLVQNAINFKYYFTTKNIIRLFYKIINKIKNKPVSINDTLKFGVNNVFEASLLLKFILNKKY